MLFDQNVVFHQVSIVEYFNDIVIYLAVQEYEAIACFSPNGRAPLKANGPRQALFYVVSLVADKAQR
jgi:hypothetical protein